MTRIHATAVIAPGAQIWGDVEIGPYCVIGEHVQIDSGTVIGPHVVIDGHTSIGRDNRIYQFASLGAASQDKKYNGEPTRLDIGNRNTIREFVTVHRGTVQDNSVTCIGDDNWIMNYVHIAHDCIIGNDTILANNATLAGHVELGDYVFLGGFTTVHQFCRIGAHAMSAFTAAIAQDVPPFVTAAGNRAAPTGLNSEGLRRRGFSTGHIQEIKRAYRTLYRSGLTLEQALEQLQAAADSAASQHGEAAVSLQMFADFVRQSGRGIIR